MSDAVDSRLLEVIIESSDFGVAALKIPATKDSVFEYTNSNFRNIFVDTNSSTLTVSNLPKEIQDTIFTLPTSKSTFYIQQRGLYFRVETSIHSQRWIGRFYSIDKMELRRCLNEAVEAANLGMWHWNPDRDLLLINATWGRIFGETPKARLANVSTWSDRLHPEDKDQVLQELGKHLAGETPVFAIEYRMRHKAGHWIWVLDRGKVVERDSQGAPIEITGITQDITKRVELEHELRLAKQQAEQRGEAQTRFWANISHEIRTPLNGVIGALDLLKRSDVSTDKKSELIEIGYTSAHVLIELVNDILDLSKIEAGCIELEKRPFNINQVINEVIRVCQWQAQEKGYDIVSHSECDTNFIGDSFRIRQILLNLTNNAVKFTSEGEVSITARSTSTQNPNIDFLQIEVKDTGVGISEDKLDKIFDAFTQAETSTTRRFGGTGLGLTICKHLSDLMNASIEVRNNVDRGTCFCWTVRLPKINKDQLTNDINTKDEVQLHKYKALVVDDNKINRLTMRKMLENMGIEVSLACAGQEALQIITQTRFDFILMDYHMTGMNGAETTQLIRKNYSQLGKPIANPFFILQSAEILSEHYGDLFDEYLVKPITYKELNEKLVQLASLRLKLADSNIELHRDSPR